jgi:FkbM family methyltransferase
VSGVKKSEILNRIFDNRFLKSLMPGMNLLLTFFRNGKWVVTKFNPETKRYVSKEKKRTIYVDEKFYWNVSYSRLQNTLMAIVCRKYLPKRGDIVIDLGAGVGTETVVFQELVGEEGRVYAIEPHPRTAASLNLLCGLNGFHNVLVSQLAIGKYDGSIMMENRDNHAQNTIKENDLKGPRVRIMTFDHFIEQKKISRIDFLKINIEGAETDLIEGMANSIGIVKNLAVSCHDFLDPLPNDRIRKKMIGFLEGHNFQVEESQDTYPVRRSWLFAQKT